MSTAITRAQVVDINRQPANPKEAIATLRDLLERQKGEIAKVLPKHLSSDRLAKVAVAAVSRDRKLMECTPVSVLRSIMQAASLGFEPGGPLGDSYLIPYKGQCQLIPGYRGLISLARRSGQILSIEADVVREKDAWTFRKTQDGTFFEHLPSVDAQPGEIVRVYAVARLKDTPLPVIVVMPRREVDSIMRATQSKGGYGPWKDHYAEMAKKTAIRRLTKYLPMSVEFADALDREDRVERGEPVDGEVIDMGATEPSHGEDPNATPEQPGQARDAAATRVSGLDSLVSPGRKANAAEEAPTCDVCNGENGSHMKGCPGNE